METQKGCAGGNQHPNSKARSLHTTGALPWQPSLPTTMAPNHAAQHSRTHETPNAPRTHQTLTHHYLARAFFPVAANATSANTEPSFALRSLKFGSDPLIVALPVARLEHKKFIIILLF